MASSHRTCSAVSSGFIGGYLEGWGHLARGFNHDRTAASGHLLTITHPPTVTHSHASLHAVADSTLIDEESWKQLRQRQRVPGHHPYTPTMSPDIINAHLKTRPAEKRVSRLGRQNVLGMRGLAAHTTGILRPLAKTKVPNHHPYARALVVINGSECSDACVSPVTCHIETHRVLPATTQRNNA